MTLKALIIRADGVLADTGELKRQALNQAIADGGFKWTCERADYAAALLFGSAPQPLVASIMPKLGYTKGTDDAKHLSVALARRKASLFSEYLDEKSLDPRPGLSDLAMAARGDGIRLALVTPMRSDDARRIAKAALGEDGPSRFEVMCGANASSIETPLSAVYSDAVQKLGLDPCDCLAIDCSAEGLNAAAAAGVKALIVPSQLASHEGLDSAVFVATDLPSLIDVSGVARLNPLTAEQRSDLINALHRLHAGHSDPLGPWEGLLAMKVSAILQAKGSVVKTIETGASVRELSERLKNEGVGAMVVLDRSGKISGIISERDVARGCAEHGSKLAGMLVSDLMTKAVVTCSPDDTVANISRIMTQRRIRHLPVIRDGALAGIVSIGDVIKCRLDEVQLEANVLRDYALARG
jgi:CBS domain-containing protein/beta-phosphoglucomutase-like phosphatase (HAD superfamily)